MCDFEIIVPVKTLNIDELYDDIAGHITKIFTDENIYNLNKHHSVMWDVFEIFDLDYDMDYMIYYWLVDNDNPNFKINKALNL